MNKTFNHLAHFVIIIGLIALGASHIQAATRYVARNGQTETWPYTNGWASAASNIQDAVNAAVTGDTVLVGAGRYTAPTNAVFADGSTNVVYIKNKLLTLRSFSSVPGSTIIDGEGINRGIQMAYGGTDYANQFVLDGFTVTNGYSPALGGGLYMLPGGWTGVVQNCMFTHCTQGSGSGAGGMYLYNVSRIDTVGPNTTLVSNSVFRSNQGGGLYIRQNAISGSRVNDCRFEDNAGIGLVIYGGSNTADKCVISGNINLGQYGSGVMVWNTATLQMRNCLIYNNYSGAAIIGGAVGVNSALVELYNCTVVSNTHAGSSAAGGLYSHNKAPMTLWNSIVYSNFRTNGTLVNYSGNSTTAGISMTNCCTFPAFAGDGNISNNPAFVNFDTADYRLSKASHCIDAGTNQAWMASAKDLDGKRRLDRLYGLVDMGCYEYVYEVGTMILVR